MAPPKSKYREIAEFVHTQIRTGILQPGESLPSYRMMMKQHGVTVGTVRQAIQMLESARLVDTLPRVGCVVAAKTEPWLKVGVAIVGLVNETDVFVLQALHGEFAQLHCDVGLHFVADATSQDALDALVEWGRRQDGVLMVGWVSVRVLQALHQAGVRTVQCGEPIDGPCPTDVSSVAVSVESLVGLAIGHLAGLNHRRIGLYTPTGSRYFDLLVKAFGSCCADYQVDGLVHFLPLGSQAQCASLLAWLDGLTLPPSALLVDNACTATQAIKALTENGWPVPERISVMSTSLAAQDARIVKELTCVELGTREMFRRAVRCLLNLMESDEPQVRHELIVAKYIPGETCKRRR